ncbi:MAG: hypothetical protein AAB378_03385 [Patescibacteria group bacterium]
MKILAKVIFSMLATCIVALPTTMFMFWAERGMPHSQSFPENCFILYGSLWLLAWFQLIFGVAWFFVIIYIWFVLWMPKKP